jgi:predicted DNA-binding protein (MmcQ/YjbR family)
MTIEELASAVQAYCLSLPEAWEDHPWGENAYKVRKKGFVFSSFHEEGWNFTVKLPHSGADVLERDDTKPTGYGLGKHGWVSFRTVETPSFDIEEAKAWVDESYRAVAPKTLARQVAV